MSLKIQNFPPVRFYTMRVHGFLETFQSKLGRGMNSECQGK